MKKLLLILAALLLTAASAMAATPTDLATGTDLDSDVLYGRVLSYTEGRELILLDMELQQITIALDGTETITAEEPLSVGDFIIVHPKESVVCIKMTGTVLCVYDDGALLNVDSEVYQGEYRITCYEDQKSLLQPGAEVLVYFDGAMTKSMPPVLKALHIRGRVITGTVTGLEENGFSMTAEDGENAVILLEETTAVFAGYEVGDTIRVAVNGWFAAADATYYTATELLPSVTEE